MDRNINSYLIYPITDHEEKIAREVLAERIANGEKAEDILKIYDSYYLKKVLDGTCKIDSMLYHRITGEDAKETVLQNRCVACGSLISIHRRFCKDCHDRIYKDRMKKHYRDSDKRSSKHHNIVT